MTISFLALLSSLVFLPQAHALEPLLLKNVEVTELIFADPESIEGSGPYFALSGAYPIPVCPHLEPIARGALIQTLIQSRLLKLRIPSVGVYFPSDKVRTCIGIMKF